MTLNENAELWTRLYRAGKDAGFSAETHLADLLDEALYPDQHPPGQGKVLGENAAKVPLPADKRHSLAAMQLGWDFFSLELKKVLSQNLDLPSQAFVLETAYLKAPSHQVFRDFFYGQSWDAPFFVYVSPKFRELILKCFLSNKDTVLYLLHQIPVQKILVGVETVLFFRYLLQHKPFERYKLIQNEKLKLESLIRRHENTTGYTQSLFFLDAAEASYQAGFFKEAEKYINRISPSQAEYDRALALKLQLTQLASQAHLKDRIDQKESDEERLSLLEHELRFACFKLSDRKRQQLEAVLSNIWAHFSKSTDMAQNIADILLRYREKLAGIMACYDVFFESMCQVRFDFSFEKEFWRKIRLTTTAKDYSGWLARLKSIYYEDVRFDVNDARPNFSKAKQEFLRELCFSEIQAIQRTPRFSKAEKNLKIATIKYLFMTEKLSAQDMIILIRSGGEGLNLPHKRFLRESYHNRSYQDYLDLMRLHNNRQRYSNEEIFHLFELARFQNESITSWMALVILQHRGALDPATANLVDTIYVRHVNEHPKRGATWQQFCKNKEHRLFYELAQFSQSLELLLGKSHLVWEVTSPKLFQDAAYVHAKVRHAQHKIDIYLPALHQNLGNSSFEKVFSATVRAFGFEIFEWDLKALQRELFFLSKGIELADKKMNDLTRRIHHLGSHEVAQWTKTSKRLMAWNPDVGEKTLNPSSQEKLILFCIQAALQLYFDPLAALRLAAQLPLSVPAQNFLERWLLSDEQTQLFRSHNPFPVPHFPKGIPRTGEILKR